MWATAEGHSIEVNIEGIEQKFVSDRRQTQTDDEVKVFLGLYFDERKDKTFVQQNMPTVSSQHHSH
jgi:hypothetical protein